MHPHLKDRTKYPSTLNGTIENPAKSTNKNSGNCLPFQIKSVTLHHTHTTGNMGYSINDKIEWTMIFIYEFGRKHGLTLKQAFNYLDRYQGMAFLDKYYDYVHTQSFNSMVRDITEYCQRKGGGIK